MMFSKPSLMTRIVVGKIVGAVIGLAGFLMLPLFWPEADWLIRWGVLLWYTTVGAIIGVMGVYTRHPLLNFPMPWWLRAPGLGAWMNFVLVFFTYEKMETILVSMFGVESAWTSPFWFVLEGALVGLIIGFLATRLGGEGEAALRAYLRADEGH